jgi:3'-phosphoadenosine 5'-phosphosulfate (PAPS) 3'-phosphatase
MISSLESSTSSDGIGKVSLLDLAACALSSAIVAADQITSLAYGGINLRHHLQQQQEDGSVDGLLPPNISNSTGTVDNQYNYEQKNVRLKNDGSFVTDADLAAQQIIVDSFRRVSWEVRIVGEESEEEMRQNPITGHEERSEYVFGLSKEEIEIRYRRSSGPLPLAQIKRNKKSDGGHRSTSESSSHHDDDEGRKGSTAAAAAENHSSDPPSTSLESEQYPYDKMEVYEVDPKRVSIFIDPLDGTQAYAKGEYDIVSILIAVILDETPCFGVICKPFGYRGQTSVLDTGCVAIYGGTLLGAAFTAGGSMCTFPTPSSQQHENPSASSGGVDPTTDASATAATCSTDSPITTSLPERDLPRAVISSSRSEGIVREFVTHLGDIGIIDPKPMLISGAGEKSLRIILRSENEGLWFFPKGGTSLWDVAASDALLRATGGRLSDKNGNDMDYTKSRTEAENEDGVVACYDERLHAECIRLFLEGTWGKNTSTSSSSSQSASLS